MSVLGAVNEQSVTLAAIENLRRNAKIYRDKAAQMESKSLADMLHAMSVEYDEAASQLEVKIILSRTIETTGG